MFTTLTIELEHIQVALIVDNKPGQDERNNNFTIKY